jgi:hypothetical protein
MAQPEDEAKYNEARFLALVSGLSAGIMQHLGKVVNPLTGKIERDLQAAQGTIDMLRMLKEKTRGNLTDREQRTLDVLIGGAQLNYLDEVTADQEKAKEKPEEKAEGEPAEEPEEKPAEEPREEPPAEEKKAEETAETKEVLADEKKEEPAAETKKKPSQGKTETGAREEPETEEESGETSADEDTPQA